MAMKIIHFKLCITKLYLKMLNSYAATKPESGEQSGVKNKEQH